LDAVEASGLELNVDVVLAKGAPHRAALQRQLTSRPGTRLLAGVENMAELLGGSDIAIGAAGSTSWERCCLGLPTIILITADNQRFVAKGLQQAGAAYVLGDAAEIDKQQLAVQLRGLVEGHAARSAMSHAAAGVCDGLGLQRVAALMNPPSAHDGQPVSLRPVMMMDVDVLYQWQCDPRTRRFFHNPDPPRWDSHVVWVQSRINERSSFFNMIMHGGESAGVLRLDSMDEHADGYMVSVLVAPDHYRQGLASGALALVRRMLPDAELHAQVLTPNEASRHLFEAAGYRFDERLGHYLNKPAVSGS